METTIGVVTQDVAEIRWVIRDRVKFMGEVAGTELAIVEIDIPPQSGPPPHTHASPEIFRIISGEITFGSYKDNISSTIVAGPGTVVTVPPYQPHNYVNLSGKPATMLVVLNKQMLDFFLDIGTKEQPATASPDHDEIVKIIDTCRKHGIEILDIPQLA